MLVRPLLVVDASHLTAAHLLARLQLWSLTTMRARTRRQSWVLLLTLVPERLVLLMKMMMTMMLWKMVAMTTMMMETTTMTTKATRHVVPTAQATLRRQRVLSLDPLVACCG